MSTHFLRTFPKKVLYNSVVLEIKKLQFAQPCGIILVDIQYYRLRERKKKGFGAPRIRPER